MRVIRDFSRYSLPFFLDSTSEDETADHVGKNFYYKTKKVKVAADVNLNWKLELLGAVKTIIIPRYF